MTNIVIVSASIGSGHTQAAKAIQAQVLKQYPQAQVQVVDFLEAGDSYFCRALKETYLNMLTIVPDMYDFLYRWSQIPLPGDKVQNFLAMLMKKAMLQVVTAYKPDIMIFTHPFPCGAAALLCRSGKLNIPLFAVMTDFVAHRFWVYPEINTYFVANAEIAAALVKENVLPGRICVTGIPIADAFAGDHPQISVRNKLGLDNRPVILVMGGGLGLIDVPAALAELARIKLPLQVVVITGKNGRLRKELRDLVTAFPHYLKVMGYTRQIVSYMNAATVLLTKPGALTCSEALAVGLPLVLWNALPGQEAGNAAYLVRNKVAVHILAIDELSPILTQLLTSPRRLAAMNEQARLLAKPAAAAAIAGNLSAYIRREPGKATG